MPLAGSNKKGNILNYKNSRTDAMAGPPPTHREAAPYVMFCLFPS